MRFGRGEFLALVAANLALRLYLATLPGYLVDVAQYKEWAAWTGMHGLAAAYDSKSVDYPPVILYPMWVVGEIYLALEPQPIPDKVVDSTLFTFLVKTPHVVADFALAGLVMWIVARRGTWGPRREGAPWGRLAALLYLWNPAVLWDCGYWGQFDGGHSVLIVGALAALAADRSAASGALLAAAGLTKPLAAPLLPLLAWTTFVRRGTAGLLRAALAGLAAGALLFAPFIVTGRLSDVLRRILLDVEAMPHTSVNAHNLWWILGPWRDAGTAAFAFVTPEEIGITLFVTACVVLGVRVDRRLRAGTGGSAEFTAELFLVAAAVTSSFFFLSTHMHENHLFMTLPILIVIAGRSRSLAWLAAGCSLAVLANTMLHDVDLPYRLPSFLSAPAPVLDRHLDRPYTWVQFVGSFLDTLLVAAVAGGCWRQAWRGRP